MGIVDLAAGGRDTSGPPHGRQVHRHRAHQSNTNQAPPSLGKVARFMQKHEGKIAIMAGTGTDDTRLLNTPKLSVVALNFTELARAHIVKAGGECLSFD
ncbi:60S ribosomal protein L18 [Phytophthora pseudosyringae]|uniref:60S ribosomal protein L18 n=1 Tax=Phytophthora pseudosyringae TaxID=221518 RepID=A0A8T1V4U0_9STRA|nr:60S ribosomal protein L18 [Phytophthora pseudosyringae]